MSSSDPLPRSSASGEGMCSGHCNGRSGGRTGGAKLTTGLSEANHDTISSSTATNVPGKPDLVTASLPLVLDYPFAAPPGPGEVIEVAPRIHWLRMPLPFAPDLPAAEMEEVYRHEPIPLTPTFLACGLLLRARTGTLRAATFSRRRDSFRRNLQHEL